MSLVQTLMQTLRAKYEPKTMDKNELRFSRYGAWDFTQQQTAAPGGIFTDDVKQKIARSFGNTVTVPVLDAETVAIGSTRSCTISPDENTSQLITLTFVTYSWGFTMTPAQHFNNDISYEQDFARKFDKYLQQLAAVLDTAAVANFETNRNQYYPTAITNYYSVVGNALQVPQASKNDYFNQASTIVETMDYYNRINVVGSTSTKPMLNRLMSQGMGNAINESFQFDNYGWNFTNRIVPASGIESTHYLIPDGNVAVFNRNTPDAIAKSRTGKGQVWGTTTLPVVGLNVGTFYYDDCADMSALHAGTTGLTRTKMEGFAFDTDVCFATVYNSSPSTRYSPIIKTEISAS